MFGFFVFDVSESGLSPQFMVVVSRSKNGKLLSGVPHFQHVAQPIWCFAGCSLGI
jgi:hypothetical protein